MRSMTVKKHSVFPATMKEVFFRLQQMDTLRYIARPYATFTPVNSKDNLVWQAGKSFAFHFKLFGVIPLGVHTIRVIEFSPNGIYTREGNPFVPIWNHRIVLQENNAASTGYTDEVEISAGWKTPFAYLWAKAFYAHRQKKWQKLLREDDSAIQKHGYERAQSSASDTGSSDRA